MAQNTKHERKQTPRQQAAGRASAESVGREPEDKPTPDGSEVHLDHAEEPKGHPTSDRFHTEKAGKAR